MRLERMIDSVWKLLKEFELCLVISTSILRSNTATKAGVNVFENW